MCSNSKLTNSLSPVVTSYIFKLVTESPSNIIRVTKVINVTNFLKEAMENSFSVGRTDRTLKEEILHGLLKNLGDFDDFGYTGGIASEFCNQFRIQTGYNWLQNDEATS